MSRRFRPRDVILMYHSVEENPTGYRYAVTARQLEEQILEVKRHFDIVPLAKMTEPPGQKPRAALSFDDAFEDFYSSAFPVLQRLQVQATVFVPTDFIETGWQMREDRGHCTWGQLREMVASELVDAQSHGHSHRHIRSMSDVELRKDIMKSKEVLESQLQREVVLFAYPGGKFSEGQHQTILDMGFRAVCTSRALRIESDRQILPRFGVLADWSRRRLNAELSGTRELLGIKTLWKS